MAVNPSVHVNMIWDLLAQFPPFSPSDRRSVSHRSIVRMIGTLLPLAPPPRIFFSPLTEPPSTLDFSSPPEFTLRSECACCEEIKLMSSTNKLLQDEVDKLKEMISSFVLEKEHRFPPVSGMLPPPPPPMPPTNYNSLPSSFSKRRAPPKPAQIARLSPDDPAATLGLVLSQLSNERPQLRHVERSPGGRPVRRKKSPEIDPSNVLSLVLKKRYTALHASSESLNTSLGDNNFTSPGRVCA